VAVTHTDVLGLLQGTNRWAVLHPATPYDFDVMLLDSALRHLHACWPERMSFVELARQIVQSGTPPGPDVGKLAAVAARFPAGPVLVRCLRHGTLRRDCPTQYPPGGPPDDALIVEDGNHRLTALALRLARGAPVPVTHVGVFTARL